MKTIHISHFNNGQWEVEFWGSTNRTYSNVSKSSMDRLNIVLCSGDYVVTFTAIDFHVYPDMVCDVYPK